LRALKRRYKKDSEHQVWEEGSHPEQIHNDAMMLQKLEYALRRASPFPDPACAPPGAPSACPRASAFVGAEPNAVRRSAQPTGPIAISVPNFSPFVTMGNVF